MECVYIYILHTSGEFQRGVRDERKEHRDVNQFWNGGLESWHNLSPHQL